MVKLIRTDPNTGKVIVTTIDDDKMRQWDKEWERLHPREFNYFYCSYCKKESIIRPSQDYRSTTQYCVNCYKWRTVTLKP